jgi:hypothetical protein
MHFEILVEDKSGKAMLEILVPKIIGSHNTFKITAFKGIGRIPQDLRGTPDPRKRYLLNHLPGLLRGYGKTYKSGYSAAVFVVCDLDDKCLKAFRKELFAILDACPNRPETRFCIAIEEGEAWLLGDLPAVKKAYPEARSIVLNSYVNDSICGTWELLAEAVLPQGSAGLKYPRCGYEKSQWAEKISPLMNVHQNKSESFNYFKNKLEELAES